MWDKPILDITPILGFTIFAKYFSQYISDSYDFCPKWLDEVCKLMSQKEYLIAVAHQRDPLMEFEIKPNKTIYILLTGDMIIPQNDDYLQLRTKKSILEEDSNDDI